MNCLLLLVFVIIFAPPLISIACLLGHLADSKKVKHDNKN